MRIITPLHSRLYKISPMELMAPGKCTLAAMVWRISAFSLLMTLAACSSVPDRVAAPVSTLELASPEKSFSPDEPARSKEPAAPEKSISPPDGSDDDNGSLLDTLLAAESRATRAGRKVLATAREMTLDRREIVRGSCWDYTNAVYNRTGYPNNKTGRKTIFRSSKENGPYADAALIQPGDWLYYINHSYNGIEHSAIFVKWINLDERTALMLSYGGEKRKEPARYLPYDISHVYQIVRPAEDNEDQLASSR